MENHVFLSYSFKDMYRARSLRDGLRFYGLAVWPAGSLMPGAPSWRAAAFDRLLTAVCVVLVLTKDTPHSYWVLKALDAAAAHDIPILPVVMDGSPGHRLLIDLTGDVWFDLRWSRSYTSELSELAAAIQELAQLPPVRIARNA